MTKVSTCLLLESQGPFGLLFWLGQLSECKQHRRNVSMFWTDLWLVVRLLADTGAG